ncbi:family 4 glycosyl hydrolase, partial [Klebsiella pneumoniae]
ALAHNTLGQETTGAGGFAMAMRSIPAILHYCRLIEEHAAEDAILFNFTNPSGLVTEAIIKSGFKRRVYGICDAPSELIRELPE